MVTTEVEIQINIHIIILDRIYKFSGISDTLRVIFVLALEFQNSKLKSIKDKIEKIIFKIRWQQFILLS